MADMRLIIDENGIREHNDEFDVVIHCENEQQMNSAMELLHLANRMHWHDAESDPPDDNQEVLVYRDGIGSTMGIFDHEIHKRWLDANTFMFLDGVTHWMEQPVPPKEVSHE